MGWRKDQRERLIAERLALSADVRAGFSARIAEALDEALDEVGDGVAGLTVSTYWPFRGEPDLRAWMERVAALGGHGALPVVVEKAAPLIFRAWSKGDPLERGVWNIPVPADGAETTPDIVIAPVVGFDRDCYRLGYGGGFFDRTLAGLHARGLKPRVIGVGYESALMATIRPESHDIAMDMIVTENGVRRPAG